MIRTLARRAVAIAVVGASLAVVPFTAQSATADATSSAVSWAKSQIGTDIDDGLCLTFVFAAYSAAGVNLRNYVTVSIGSNTYPVDIWNHFSHGTTGSGLTPPSGALVFFAAKNGDRTLSHVAISVGGGNMVSTTDGINESAVHYETVAQHAAYANELGWWLPLGTNTTGGQWEGVAGSLARIALGPQGELWGVDAGGTIYQYAGLGKWNAKGTGFRDVTVGVAGDGGPHVYATLTNGGIRRWLVGTGWVGVAGSLAQIALGPQGELWGVNSGGTIYQYAGLGKWNAKGTGFYDVTVGVAGDGGPHVYATLTNGGIRRWTTS
jgi:hypothetical protein